MNSDCTTEAADAAFRALFQECMASCLWFWSTREVPSEVSARIEALRQIELHGTRDQFVRARSLRQWL